MWGGDGWCVCVCFGGGECRGALINGGPSGSWIAMKQNPAGWTKKRGECRIERENECACHCVLEKAQSGAKEWKRVQTGEEGKEGQA